MYTLSDDQNTLSYSDYGGVKILYRAVDDDGDWCTGCTFASRSCPNNGGVLEDVSSKCMPSLRNDARSIIWVKET